MSHQLNVTVLDELSLRMTRVFDAPLDLVWLAHTSCEHLKHWWARGNPLDCSVDFRVGGKYRFVEQADGTEHAFRGEYLEIVPQSKIVQTFEYEGMPGHIVTDNHEFTFADGKTTITVVSTFASKEDLDGMIASGMEQGAGESYNALEAYLKTL